jgi:hypothetical protein
MYYEGKHCSCKKMCFLWHCNIWIILCLITLPFVFSIFRWTCGSCFWFQGVAVNIFYPFSFLSWCAPLLFFMLCSQVRWKLLVCAQKLRHSAYQIIWLPRSQLVYRLLQLSWVHLCLGLRISWKKKIQGKQFPFTLSLPVLLCARPWWCLCSVLICLLWPKNFFAASNIQRWFISRGIHIG